MNGLLLLQTDLQLIDVAIKQNRPSHSGIFQTLVVLSAILGIVLLAFVWAAFVRKRRRRHRHRHHWLPHSGPAAANGADAPPEREPVVRSKRRRRDRRPRNPTLAETRGLPPARSEDSSAPPPF